MYARITGFLLVFALAITGLATAQERFGTLQGRVTDQQSAPVPGVTVTTTNTQTGEIRSFVTDASGVFRAADLNPGRYTVVFELTGFSKVERKDVAVLLGRTFDLNAELRVGALTEVVQVTGEATPLVDTRSTMVAHNVTAEEIDRIPKGRSFQSVAMTAPSVNSGDLEGGFQVKRSQRLREPVHDRWRSPRTAAERQSSEHRSSSTSGSTGQDGRHHR
jgi:hypothetical protein